MSKSLRQFLSRTSLGLLGAAAAGPSKAQKPAELPPGAPPAFGTAPAVGPEVSPSTFAEAEKLMQVELSGTERAVAAGSWRTHGSALRATHGAAQGRVGTGTRTLVALGPGAARPKGRSCARPICPDDPGPLPTTDADLAFAPLVQLSRWIEQRKLTSERKRRPDTRWT